MKLTQNYEESFFTRFAKVAKGNQTDSKRREKTDRQNEFKEKEKKPDELLLHKDNALE